MLDIKRAESSDDFSSIADLADVIWHECFKVILTRNQIDYMVDKFQSYTAINKAVQSDGYVYYMAYCDDDLCGYCGVRKEDNGDLFISKVYVRSDMRKKGVATAFFNRLSTDFLNSSRWHLTVNKYNTQAIDTYKKRGFKVVRSLVTDIGGGFVMDDYIMERRIQML